MRSVGLAAARKLWDGRSLPYSERAMNMVEVVRAAGRRDCSDDSLSGELQKARERWNGDCEGWWRGEMGLKAVSASEVLCWSSRHSQLRRSAAKPAARARRPRASLLQFPSHLSATLLL